VEKTLKVALIVLTILFVGLASFSGGFAAGHFLPINSVPFGAPFEPINPPTPSAEQNDATPGELQALFTPFWEAWNIIHEQYVDQPVDDLALMQGAIHGMIEALGDQHSSYMDPVTFQAASDELSGAYEGIGAYVDTGGDYLTVTSPIPGSPADKADLRPGDQFIAIDGEDMTGVDPELARRKVIGPAGTTVHLSIKRENVAEPLEFDIVREKIVIESASGKMLDDGIAYVQVTTFGDKTTPELKTTLEDLMAQNPKGLVLDLRNNGGGYLSTAVEVTSQFVDEGVVLYEQYGDGRKNTYEVESGGLATTAPS
jgi:carboxyl-terminal processing protease